MQSNIYANVLPLAGSYESAQIDTSSRRLVGILLGSGSSVSSGSSLARNYWVFNPTFSMGVTANMTEPQALDFMPIQDGVPASYSSVRLVAASGTQGTTAFALLGLSIHTGISTVFLEVGKEYAVPGQKIVPRSAIHAPVDHFQRIDYDLLRVNMTSTGFFFLLEVA